MWEHLCSHLFPYIHPLLPGLVMIQINYLMDRLSVQSVAAYLSPPIAVVYTLAILSKRINEEVGGYVCVCPLTKLFTIYSLGFLIGCSKRCVQFPAAANSGGPLRARGETQNIDIVKKKWNFSVTTCICEKLFVACWCNHPPASSAILFLKL